MMKSLFLLCCFMFCLVSCDDIVEVVDISNESVEILAPTNESILDTTAISFTWNPVEDAEFYHLQIATPSFINASQILEDTLIPKTNLIKTLEVGHYEWRIRGENSNYQTTYIITSFSVDSQ